MSIVLTIQSILRIFALPGGSIPSKKRRRSYQWQNQALIKSVFAGSLVPNVLAHAMQGKNSLFNFYAAQP
jgi:hypothetical protein